MCASCTSTTTQHVYSHVMWEVVSATVLSFRSRRPADSDRTNGHSGSIGLAKPSEYCRVATNTQHHGGEEPLVAQRVGTFPKMGGANGLQGGWGWIAPRPGHRREDVDPQSSE